jgi:hypothetical protein
MKTLNSKVESPAEPGRARRVIMLAAFCVLCLALVGRHTLLNGFTILPGDRYDVVISTTILEHWYLFFIGQADWSQVNYFYPYTRTIAQTDAFFLLGAAYFPFRLAGFDPFIAAEFANYTVRACGFAFMYLLLRRMFAFSFGWALLAAGLFTISTGLASHASRIQFTALAFAPLVTLLIGTAIKALMDGDARRFRNRGVAAGLLYGAWCLTCFYVAWFYTYLFSFTAIIMFAWAGAAWRAQFGRRLLAHYGSVLAVLGATAIGIAPFVYAFLPKSREVGVRTYESVLSNTIPWQNILQVGPDNMMFGRLYNAILQVVSPSYTPVGEYATTGFAPILFVLFVAGCLQLLRQRLCRELIILPALALATTITWLLALQIGGHSGWFLIYHLFPGAKALNVVASYQFVLVLPVVLIAVRFLSTQRMGKPIALLLGALLVAEELTKPYLNLDRKAEIARLTLPHSPPALCKVFYVSGWEGQETLGGFPEPINNAYAHSVTAMMLAQKLGMPTINGVASFTPKDWNFGAPNQANYDDRVFFYARKYDIRNLCKLDLNTKQWRIIDAAEIARAPDISRPYFKKSDWPGVISADQGLSFVEPWGVWSTGAAVKFDFSTALPEKFELQLRAHAFGTNVGKEFVVQVGDEEGRFKLSSGTEALAIELSNPKGTKTLVFRVPSPVSPKEMGMGEDQRMLGIGLVEMRIVPK